MRSLVALALAALLTGCASSANNVRPSYVSPLQFEQLSCNQIGQEAQRISRRVAEVSGIQDEKATSDAVVTGVAIVLFWPAAFMVSGDGATASELARLKGEFETLEQVAIRKGCGIEFRKPEPKAPEKKFKASDVF